MYDRYQSPLSERYASKEIQRSFYLCVNRCFKPPLFYANL